MGPEMARSAVKYYSQLRQQSELDEEYEMMLRGFLAKMQEAQTQVNEANNITREMKKGVNLKFELAMEAPPLSFGHGPPQRSFPELVVRKVSDDNRVKSKWRLVRNRLFLISGRDNVDTAEYFRKERAREGKVIVRNIYTAAKFKNQFKVMIGDYVATTPEDGGPAEDLNIGGSGGGGGIQDVALVKQKHRDEMKKIGEEKELLLAQSSARLRKTEHTLTETQTLTLQRAEEIQNLKEALLEQQELADEDDRKLRHLERERARLLLNNEALQIELEAQRAQVQRNDSDDDDDGDEFKELTKMVAANSKKLSDLAELRSGTHISYNRVVTATKK